MIDELEMQLDERAQATASSSSSTYHIDDQTLRQLFLSYFTAEKSKQPDIAMLLASVLGYPQEVCFLFFYSLYINFLVINVLIAFLTPLV